MDPRRSTILLPALPHTWLIAKGSQLRALKFGVFGSCFFVILGFGLVAAGYSMGYLFLGLIPFLAIAYSMVATAIFYSPRRVAAGLSSAKSSGVSRVATFVPCARLYGVLYTLLILVSVPVMVAMPVVVLGSPLADEYSIRGAVVAIAGSLAAVMALPYLFGYFIRGRKRMGIGMTPDGIYHRWFLGCSFFRWSQIREITPKARGQYIVELAGDHRFGRASDQLEPEETWIATFGMYRLAMSRIPAGHVTIHPALAYKALVYYFEHPDRRGELGTDSAIERIRSADFAD